MLVSKATTVGVVSGILIGMLCVPTHRIHAEVPPHTESAPGKDHRLVVAQAPRATETYRTPSAARANRFDEVIDQRRSRRAPIDDHVATLLETLAPQMDHTGIPCWTPANHRPVIALERSRQPLAQTIGIAVRNDLIAAANIGASDREQRVAQRAVIHDDLADPNVDSETVPPVGRESAAHIFLRVVVAESGVPGWQQTRVTLTCKGSGEIFASADAPLEKRALTEPPKRVPTWFDRIPPPMPSQCEGESGLHLAECAQYRFPD